MRNFFLLLAAALAASASSLALAKDKGDTYVYTGLVSPLFSLSADAITSTNDKGEARSDGVNNAPDSRIEWDAPTTLAATLGFSYGGFGFGTSFDLEDKEQQDNTDQRATKVETSYTSYDFSYFFERVGASVSYTDLQGLKITSTSGAAGDVEDPEGPDVFRPDIRLTSKSANLWLLPLRYNLDLDSFFDPAKPSQGSGIGLILGGSYDDLDLRMKRPLISDAYAGPFGADGLYLRGTFVTFSTIAGPVVTLDFHGVYCSGMVAFGTGNEHVEYKTEHGRQKTVEGTSEKLSMYVAVGYKGDGFFSSLSYLADSPGYRLNTMIVSTTKDALTFTIGRRF